MKLKITGDYFKDKESYLRPSMFGRLIVPCKLDELDELGLSDSDQLKFFTTLSETIRTLDTDGTGDNVGEWDRRYDDEMIEYIVKKIAPLGKGAIEVFLRSLNYLLEEEMRDCMYWNYPEFMENLKERLQGQGLSIERKNIVQMNWLGTQKELAELFIELKRKGWIEKFENNTIKSCFTKSNTIGDYLKPSQDKKTKEATFEKVFTKEYKNKFYGIGENRNITD